ncbi:hypothetical protein [Nonomuraea insulae]|uniref:Uncharacterized protein n=1 Tax=Nonomuraea insulae TaxID=1616787 RepID=A0ABW1CL44_9ACTN
MPVWASVGPFPGTLLLAVAAWRSGSPLGVQVPRDRLPAPTGRSKALSW